MHRGVLSSVASPVLQDYSTLSHKRQELRKTVTEHTVCVLIICITFVSETSLLRRNERHITLNVHLSSSKLLIIFVGF